MLQCLLSAEVSSLNKEDCDKLLQGRIKSLKDVVEVLFEEAGQLGDKERWLCPVTSKELGPTVKAVYLVPCGHAFSQEAIKEMKTDQCIQCNQSYKPENIVTLFPATEDEKTILQRRIDHLSEKGFTHSLKKAPGSSKKRKANKIAEEQEQPQKSDDTPQGTSVDGSKPPQTSRSQTSTPVPASRTTTPKPSSNGIKNAATANLTARVLEEENERKKRQRLINGENENLKSLFTKKGDEKRKNGDFMTRGYSIPANARYD